MNVWQFSLSLSLSREERSSALPNPPNHRDRVAQSRLPFFLFFFLSRDFYFSVWRAASLAPAQRGTELFLRVMKKARARDFSSLRIVVFVYRRFSPIYIGRIFACLDRMHSSVPRFQCQHTARDIASLSSRAHRSADKVGDSAYLTLALLAFRARCVVTLAGARR